MLLSFNEYKDASAIMEFIYGSNTLLMVTLRCEHSVIRHVEFKFKLESEIQFHYIDLKIRNQLIAASWYMAHQTGDDYEMYFTPDLDLDGPVYSITDEMYRPNCPDIVKTTMKTLESEFLKELKSLTRKNATEMMYINSLKAIFNI